MTNRAIDALYQLLTPPPDAVRLRTATVEAYGSTTCSIKLAGASISGVPFLAGYSPAVGHKALVLQTNAGVLVVLGRNA